MEKLKPKNINKSDKYSSNLYKFIRKHEFKELKAYAPQWSMLDGSFKPFDFDNPCDGEIYIGHKDDTGWLVGRRLTDILCGLSKWKEMYCYCPGPFYDNMIEITDWFWAGYEREGRALWDVHGKRHMMGDEGRWTYVGNTRKCNWSGRWYEKNITKRQKTERTVDWELQ